MKLPRPLSSTPVLRMLQLLAIVAQKDVAQLMANPEDCIGDNEYLNMADECVSTCDGGFFIRDSIG